MISSKRAHIELHIAVILYGFTAILGAVISVSAAPLVAWRVLIASSIFLFLVSWPRIRKIEKRYLYQYIGIGILVSVHWVCFYASVKLANASISLVCLATTSFFTSFIEPIFNRRRPDIKEVMIGLIIVPAMALIVSNLDTSMTLGVVVGLIAAIVAATFSSWNKTIIEHATPVDMSFIELGSATVVLCIILPCYHFFVEPLNWLPVGMDWIYLILIAVLCTNVAYILTVRSLKMLTAFTANLIINLEPVYGILLAYVILREHKELEITFYLGCAIIVTAIIIHGYLTKKNNRQNT